MTSAFGKIDYRGARGSNTGDQFHELWTLQQVLKLLDPKTDLVAVGVEGVRTETSTHSVSDHNWDGVDCTFYYGGGTLESADRIEFTQLKYSASNPQTKWTPSRLTTSNTEKGNNSVLRKMAEDFTNAKARMKQGSQLKICFISNQELSSDTQIALESEWSGLIEKADIPEKTRKILEGFSKATELSLIDFKVFLKILDFRTKNTGHP